MPFVKDDPNINRAGRPKVARHLRSILQCFQDLRIDPAAGLPEGFEIPSDYKQFTMFEFRLVADMCREAIRGRSKGHFSQMIIDRLYPSLKALDMTTDGESINNRAVSIVVASEEQAEDLRKALDSTGPKP